MLSGLKDWLRDENIVDGFSGATPLAQAAAHDIGDMPSVMEMMIGTIPGSIGETSFIAILIGAAILDFYRYWKLENYCQCLCRWIWEWDFC